MRLTIGIPTYNRALKLKLQLANLLNVISKSSYKDSITISVSNNGSDDNTIEIIKEYENIYKQSKILFFSNNFPSNNGFDSNILYLYNENISDFIWFLSDDDEIQENSIEQIFTDINKFNPDIIYYNFNQEPYTINKPYIKELSIYNFKDHIPGIKKIIDWPKLTSLVFKNNKRYIKLNSNNLGYAHVELVLINILFNGKVLLSNFFIGKPQIDYLDNIDFPPYIGNNLNKSLNITLESLNKLYLFNSLKIPYTDPFISSLNTLSCFYRGKHMLTNKLKKELELQIFINIRKLNFITLSNYKLYLEFIKFILSYFFYFIMLSLFKKNITRLRLHI